MQKTKTTKKSDVRRSWHLYDAKAKILGRAATEIATILHGKRKPYFVPHLDCGDFVVVVNAKQIRVTGGKEKKKVYTRYSGYPGGLKKEVFKDVLTRHPERIIRQAVFGMLPDNKLRDQLLKRLYIYPNSDHPYQDKFEFIKTKKHENKGD